MFCYEILQIFSQSQTWFSNVKNEYLFTEFETISFRLSLKKKQKEGKSLTSEAIKEVQE